ncbi:HD domain-containing phosphohydrolase [Vibrio hepatarius]|uniref:HD domain-containing phosphohydrolase n=1 Tax=Vibrio hepatarius TaxID=171383 RepID=UPI001C09AA32|nr:HD domain-containing phosphohydrolase [Vibrio hepatarius]MBU2896673.1 response regulator [Vibrio hepatarius]
MDKTILVVDDVPDNIRILKSVLEKGNYSVRAATNGEKALKLASTSPQPNIILLDIMMPEMDGFEVCRRLKRNPETSHIPVIFISAKDDTDDQSMGFDLGAVDYITKPFSPAIVLRRVATHLSLTRLAEVDSLALSAIRMLGVAGHYNDTDTGSHIWRMAEYCKLLAKAVGWDYENYNRLELAAPLHDTGKIGIPDAILKAPRGLDDDEWVVMKKHSEIGHEILSMSSNPVFQLGADVAKSHHERWDGTGYPEGLVGQQIPQGARIVAICDVFDALTMERPYKKAWSIEEALIEIKNNSGSHFDPDLVEIFLGLEDEIREIYHKWSLKDENSIE